MKQSYSQRLTWSFCLILVLFSISIVVFEQSREKKHRTEVLEEKLDGYTEITYQYLNRYSEPDSFNVDTLLAVLPANLRLTLINNDGKVLYDNRLHNISEIENHLERPEIQAAGQNGKGSEIRQSASNQKEYMYYAKRLGNLYIRVALPYDVQIRHFLQPDNGFLYFLLLLFILGIVLIHYTAGRFGKTIQRLRDFSMAINNKETVEIPDFPNDEIGEVGAQIAKDYKRLKESETILFLEHEKLLMHIQSSAEGVCFFTPAQKVAFYNGLFLQYYNVLSDNEIVEPSGILEEKIFAEMAAFINGEKENNFFETQISKHGKHFLGRVNMFDDDGFEIVLYDNTRAEKNKQLKQEMTGNIAHELRTPVTDIRAYLETVLDNRLDREKEREFVTKAYEQIIALSELIRDMSLLSKINEAPGSFQFKPLNLNQLIEKVSADLNESLQSKDIVIHSTVPADFLISGNEGLLYSVFRNLMDNVINYAGEGVTIHISKYNEDPKFAYFSFSDNGVGIGDEKHLNRLFERFYRVNEGRTRETGGSGLGLSIVKNAITFHGGTIAVKNSAEGGLVFLFTLPLPPVGYQTVH
jgi:signal transduction histidine kinase